jgi:hypothetical protein
MPRRTENGRASSRERPADRLHAKYAAEAATRRAESRAKRLRGRAEGDRSRPNDVPVYMRTCPVCGHFTASLDRRLLDAYVECPDCQARTASSGSPLRL